MSPQRSVVPDPELSQGARGEPVRVLLAGPGTLDNRARDKFGFLIAGASGKLKPGARSIERLAHGFDVLGLESDSIGNGSWHRGRVEALGTATANWGKQAQPTVICAYKDRNSRLVAGLFPPLDSILGNVKQDDSNYEVRQ
jgi:hypothetical protein